MEHFIIISYEIYLDLMKCLNIEFLINGVIVSKYSKYKKNFLQLKLDFKVMTLQKISEDQVILYPKFNKLKLYKGILGLDNLLYL